MNDKVSIIMPSYNTAEYIGESIQSVLGQTYMNWELIIVDDCSLDDTDTVVASYLVDERIHYLKNEQNSGAAVSRNRALREATGRWIAFLDSDDLWLPEKLEKQITFMEEFGYAFSYTCYKEMDAESRVTGIVVSGPPKVTNFGIYRFCWMGCLTVMYDSSVVGLVQVEDIKKNNDYALWLKVCKVTNCYLLNEVLATYRRGRSGSISTERYLSLLQWHYKLYRICEKKSKLAALWYTCGNLFFGVIKKLIYVRGCASTVQVI